MELKINVDSKPFLKWAGGKTKLIPEILKNLPNNFENIDTYIEPYVGGGALLFWMLKTYPNIKKAIINDINKDLTDSYNIIKYKPKEIIEELKTLNEGYLSSVDKSLFFYDIRKKFNSRTNDDLIQTSYLIFLNKTCFNGLFRVNSKNEFNVPFAKLETPKICDEKNIMDVSEVLQKVTILNGDYTKTFDYADESSFFYFDPPYKPISKSASFNAYSTDAFGDNEQNRLKEFCDKLNDNGINWILSNSDVKNINPEDNFFDDLYKDYNINRVLMKRMINSNASKRGGIFELLIKNY